MNPSKIPKSRMPKGNRLSTSIANDAALRKSSEELGLPVRKPLLPPIVCQQDKEALEKVKAFIHEEKKKIQCEDDVFDEKRFIIFSAAMDKIISQSTAYKDLLADIKREYEDCIYAILNNQREAVYVRNKVKTLTSLPTTIDGYHRRKLELEEKLGILNAANKELEAKLKDIQQAAVEPEIFEKQEDKVKTPLKEEEKRPIPGLSVEQWTDEDVLQQAISKLEYNAEELARTQKNNYVTLSQKERADALLKERMSSHENLLKKIKSLHSENQRLRVAHDAVYAYRKKKEENPGFKMTLGRFVISKLVTHHKKEQKAKATSLDVDIPLDDDDPGAEKEAELMLEYIEKFNELFSEGEYEKAAVHAANSPRGVLRSMETLKRFESVSLNFDGTPSPLLLYSTALMNSSSAQNNVADREMSLLCVRCALSENRPDLVKHWATTGCITSSNEIGRCLVAYSKSVPEYKNLCLVVAHKIFSDVENHHDACVTLFHLNHYQALIDYAQETADFTKNEYLNLIRTCPDGTLVMNLCRPYNQPHKTQREDYEIRKIEVLPLRFNQAICAMIDSEVSNSASIVEFLIGLYNGDWVSHTTGDRSSKEDTLHAIVYEETDTYSADDKSCDWWKIIRFCEANQAYAPSIEIQAAMEVKKAIANALIAIGQAGKEEFDYYT